jgi:hypothetical protein
MTEIPPKAPAIAWLYGLAGLSPFAAASVGMFIAEGEIQFISQTAMLVYSGLILSFLGGARWGLEIRREPLRGLVISLSMLPTLAAFALMFLPIAPRLQYLGLAAAFLLQWVWDVVSKDSPVWYPALRTVLTLGVTAALVAAAILAQ